VVEAVYQDNGAPFDPVQHAQVDTTLPSAERRIGGLGIHFIRRSMRSMRHQRLNGWNITLFERELIPHKS
jgi:serine/threonine-protein kinase RsbW